MLTLIALVMILGSCRQYQEKIYVEVEPNETAFVIPMEQNTDKQATFGSETFLEKKKVATKRIYTPTKWHQTGRMWFTGDYIATVRVIKVKRAPVTREWTNDGSGTSTNKKEDIEVESRESIAFGVKITATASIPEEWASRFLYNYNGRTLEQVMDYDVRGRVQNVLTSEFGARLLENCQADRAIVFDSMRTNVIEYFETMGVRIMNIGAAGDFEYLDEAIQIAINEKYSSKMKIEAAQNEVDAANLFVKARTAIVAQKELDAGINFINSCATAMVNGKFPVPSTLVIGDTKMTLMDVYGVTKLNTK
jgi:hypothetical protein